MNELVLKAAWAGHEAGTVLRVLAPGERAPEGRPALDAERADWLAAEGLSVVEQPEPKASTPKAAARRSKKGEGDGRP